MRILFLAHRVPYPPDKGDKIRSYHELRHLAERHRVTLVTMADRPEDLAHERALRELVEEVHIVRLRPLAQKLRSLLALMSGGSLSVRYFAVAEFERAVAEVARRGSFDVIFAYSSSIVAACRDLDLPTIVDLVDVDSEKFVLYARTQPQPMASVYATEAKRLRAFERKISESAPLTIVCTAAEAKVLTSFCRPRRLEVIENGVDLERYPYASPAGGKPTAVFVGAMDYLANVDACEYFVREILPHIVAELPEFQLRIVGRHPAPRVRALHDGSRVVVVGAVADVGAELHRASVSVAPLRIARGIQNKVLEAMAAGTPVVASPAAAEGLEAVAEEHLLTAADAVSFAGAVVSLCRDRARAERLSLAARALVERRFRWPINLARLEALIESVVATAA